jgi:hypothetical protein
MSRIENGAMSRIACMAKEWAGFALAEAATPAEAIMVLSRALAMVKAEADRPVLWDGNPVTFRKAHNDG